MVMYDVAVIGAGASGLMAASQALQNGHSVIILEIGENPGRKINVSGGGHCNITNTAATYDRYFGKNPQFVRGALSRFKPADMLDWAIRHNIGTRYIRKQRFHNIGCRCFTKIPAWRLLIQCNIMTNCPI